MEAEPPILPPRMSSLTTEIKPIRRRKLNPEQSFRMSLQTEMGPRRNSLQQPPEEQTSPTTSEPSSTPFTTTIEPLTIPTSGTTASTIATSSLSNERTALNEDSLSAIIPVTTASTVTSTNTSSTTSSQVPVREIPMPIRPPKSSENSKPPPPTTRPPKPPSSVTLKSIPLPTTVATTKPTPSNVAMPKIPQISRSPPIFKKIQTTKHASLPRADLTTTTLAATKTVDSLSGYMEKIAAKMKLENLSVFSLDLPERKKSKSHQETATDAPDASHKKEAETCQNIYEFIDMPPLKTVFPSRPPRGFVKTSEALPSSIFIERQPQRKPQLNKANIRSWPSHQSASLPPLTVEDVEQFFEEERKTFSNLKSSTVGAYFRRIVSTSKHSSQTNFFQQLGKRMKESFGSFARSSDILEQEQKHVNQTRAQDEDWVFFRGFGGKSPEDIVDPIYDVPRPQAPPRRKRSLGKRERRTVSMTDVRSDALFCQSGARLIVEPLYDVPRSTPIYAVVNMAAKAKKRKQNDESQILSENDKEETTLRSVITSNTCDKNETNLIDTKENVTPPSITNDKSTLQNDISTTKNKKDLSCVTDQTDNSPSLKNDIPMLRNDSSTMTKNQNYISTTTNKHDISFATDQKTTSMQDNNQTNVKEKQNETNSKWPAEFEASILASDKSTNGIEDVILSGKLSNTKNQNDSKQVVSSQIKNRKSETREISPPKDISPQTTQLSVDNPAQITSLECEGGAPVSDKKTNIFESLNVDSCLTSQLPVTCMDQTDHALPTHPLPLSVAQINARVCQRAKTPPPCTPVESAANQLAPMPSSSLSSEECPTAAASISECTTTTTTTNTLSVRSQEVNDEKSLILERKNDEKVIECLNSDSSTTCYHEEVSSQINEAKRMCEMQSENYQGSFKETTPDGLTDKTSPKWSHPENSIFISPWCNNNRVPQQQQQQQQQQQLQQQRQPQETEQSSTTPVLSCVEKSPTKNSAIHPFARRTKSRYCVEQKKLFSSTSDSSEESKPQPDIWDDSFDEIIRTANRSIETAESILSTLRRGEDTVDNIVQTHDNDTQVSPVSDIETNIRRLEKAQDEINAALATFRSVKALNGSAIGGISDCKMEHKGPPPTPPRPTLKVMSIVAKRKEQFESQKKRSTLPKSLTLQDAIDQMGPDLQETIYEGSSDQTPVRPVRRHSFNSCKSTTTTGTTTTTTESGDSHYEADVESGTGSTGCTFSREIGLQNENGSSYSDSEAGGQPTKGRIRSLWGSFRKKRMEVVQVRTASRPAPPPPTNSLYSCFGEYSDRALENGENEPQLQRLSNHGSDCATNSSSSYHTPGSPVKQQSESSSSLSSFNPRSNRDSGSSDESSEQGGVGPAKSSTSTEGGAPQDLTNPQQRKAFYIARELMSSERVFVDVLKLLNVEFRDYLQKARKESKNPVISDADFRRIFNNLTELQALNEDLLQDFEYRVVHWPESQKIADVIAKKGPFLKLYNNYIREFSCLMDHFEDCCNRFPKFKKLVQDFEKRDRCKNLKVTHYMLKPVQRLPQYRLLLEDYLKHLDPDGEDFDDTTTALRIVSEVAEQADNTIKQGENFRRMMKLQGRLGDSIELIKPGRHLIKEGELMKISRKGINPRYFILLSDCLLYTAYSGNLSTDLTTLRLSYKIPLTQLKVDVSNRADDFQNEFSITSTVRSCTLRAGTVKERNDWLDALQTAIEEHVMRKRTFKESTINKTLEPLEKTKPGEIAPVWIPDRRVTMCQKCAIEFTVLVRRHHCRACGQVVCSTCSANKAPLKYRSWRPARVCDKCYDSIETDLAKDVNLASRFQKRDSTVVRQERFVPGRLRESARGEGAQNCGYLKRKTKSSRYWKRMWYVLKDKVLYVYKASEDNVAVESFPVLGYTLDVAPFDKSSDLYEGENVNLVFRLTHPGSEAIVFCAETEVVRDKWVTALKDAVNLDSAIT